VHVLGYFIIFAAMIAAFAYTLYPLVQPSGDMGTEGTTEGGGAEEEISQLVFERERAYRNIQDIELDREMGKLSDGDYKDMIGRGRAQALEILRRLEGRGVKEGMIPAHLSEREAVGVVLQQKGAQAAPVVLGPTLDEILEAEILRYRKVLPSKALETTLRDVPATTNNFCSQCGFIVEVNDNYCAGCGRELK